MQSWDGGIISVFILQVTWPCTCSELKAEWDSNKGTRADTIFHSLHRNATLPPTAPPQEPLRYLKHSCSPFPPASFLAKPPQSLQPKVHNFCLPTTGANTGDSPVPMFHLVYASIQGGIEGCPQASPASLLASSEDMGLLSRLLQAEIAVQDGMKFLLVHILCLGLTQIHMYSIAWNFLWSSHVFQSFAFACLKLCIHF